ncbi:MAG: crossover junction endodeoxyribonuclease RuvC [Candidatus Sungbacteria bacterium]|uniref:Crossover junction endodeoxyribonuclease RuvC n=1 Tax=Candidatus Sungiibacteriota bacterium TaxID=2750080 RepID=A0A932YYH0_9BACT|nr:crossover junction endodeoxyribonuclease RuvC [Candidatus Sungbacteria bacterium]
MKIVGIDPGTTAIGYALIESDAGRVRLLRADAISVPRHPDTAERLTILERALDERMRRDRPDAVATEKLYFAKNAKTAIAVAEARGIILLTAHRHVRSIWEYTPLEIKIALTGYGRADKSQMRRMVSTVLPTAALPKSDDAVDAVAIALAAWYTERPLGASPRRR